MGVALLFRSLRERLPSRAAAGLGPRGDRGATSHALAADVPLCAPFHIGRILDRLREGAVRQVTVIVGRKCNDDHLLRAVRHAAGLGMIVGVRGLGGVLSVGNRISDMAAAGAEHVDVYCFSASEAVHDALAGSGDCKQAIRAMAAARKNGVAPAAQLALARPTLTTIEPTLQALAKHGVHTAAPFAVASAEPAEAAAGALLPDELPDAIRLVEESARRLGLRLRWSPTVAFASGRPLGEQVCRGPRSASDWAVRVEPDGSIIPPRGRHEPVANLLEDGGIWIEAAKTACAAGCLLDPAGWASARTE
jgi:hypothetical protein